MQSHHGYDAFGYGTSTWQHLLGEAGAMRTVSRTGLVSAGLGLGAVGGFVGSLLGNAAL